MAKNTYKGKIGYCDNSSLGIPKSGGHYVYVREDNDGKCTVNVVTSLEDTKGNISYDRMIKLRRGYVYPIPKKDANFSRWSGVSDSVKTVNRTSIKDVGRKSIKTRHKFFIGKYLK